MRLNVNPADLLQAADDYTELAARAARICPQAVTEVNAIVQTHGPIGYPAAVGILAGLAAPEQAVQAKAAQFGRYAERFTGHAATYTDQDQAAAAKFDAIAFPEVNVTPKPPPDEPAKYPVVCWLPSSDADPAAYCPADTTRVQYVDDNGQWIQKDITTGANETILNGEIPGVAYLTGPPPPGTDPAAQAPPGSTDILWRDNRGNLVHQHQGPPGSAPTITQYPPGRISW